MSTDARNHGSSARKPILTISLSQHLHGVPISQGIETDWAKEKAKEIRDCFDNIGFNLDPKDAHKTLSALKETLEERPWEGVIVGWCTRGNVEFTVLFEQIIAMCCETKQSKPNMKLMFCTGPDNLVETVKRNFPSDISLE